MTAPPRLPPTDPAPRKGAPQPEERRSVRELELAITLKP